MEASFDIVDLLKQVSVAVPVTASFQPIFGAIQIMLQRAQKLSDNKRKFANLAGSVAQLALDLHEQIGENIDNLGDRVRCHLDDILRIIYSISSEMLKVDKNPTWKKFVQSKSVEGKLSELQDKLQISISKCQIGLGIDTCAKLGDTRNIVLRTHDRLLDMQTQMQQFHISHPSDLNTGSDLKVFSRSDLFLCPGEIKSRTIWPNSERTVVVSIYNGVLQGSTRVLVKCFKGLQPDTAKMAFEKELEMCDNIWNPSIVQAIGHLSRSNKHLCIVYHSPDTSHRLPLFALINRFMGRDCGRMLYLMLSLQEFVRQWVATIDVYPIYTFGGKEKTNILLWLQSISYDTREFHHSPEATPVFEGELCSFERSTTAIDVLTDKLMIGANYYLRWLYQEKMPVMSAINASMIQSKNSSIFSLDLRELSPLSPEDIARTIEDSEWRGVNTKPSLVIGETGFELNDTWRWFRGDRRLEFRHDGWDAEIECRQNNWMEWFSGNVCSYQYVGCICEFGNHGLFRRNIHRLRIDWPDTPLDGFEFRSENYVAGMESEWEIIVPPSVAPDHAQLSETESNGDGSDSEADSDHSEDFHSAEEHLEEEV